MNILSSQKTWGAAPVKSYATQAQEPAKQEQAQTPPQDSFQESKFKPSKTLVPAGIALGSAAVGLVGGFANGIAGGIAGAVSGGMAGATASTVVASFEEFSGEAPNYTTRAVIGGAIGAAFGGLVGSMSQSGGVAAGLAVAGTIGATLGYSFLKN